MLKFINRDSRSKVKCVAYKSRMLYINHKSAIFKSHIWYINHESVIYKSRMLYINHKSVIYKSQMRYINHKRVIYKSQMWYINRENAIYKSQNVRYINRNCARYINRNCAIYKSQIGKLVCGLISAQWHFKTKKRCTRRERSTRQIWLTRWSKPLWRHGERSAQMHKMFENGVVVL